MEKPTKEELENLIITENMPYTHIAKIYEVSNVTIKKWAVNYEIQVPTRKVSLKGKISKCPNCGIEFAAALKAIRGYEAYLKDNSLADGKRNMQPFKKYFLEDQEHKCSICGMEDT